MALLPPVVATLVADTKQFTGSMAKAQAQMDEFGDSSVATSAKMNKFGNRLANAVLGIGVAVAAFSIDEGYKFTESMDQLQNATGMSTAALKVLEGTIISVSNTTGASTADLATAYGNIYQAGIRGAAATTLLNDAAKAALATNTNVVDVTQSLIAVQSLHLKGTKDLTDATGVLVAGSHNFVGGLQEEVSMLQGKVGSAFSEYGFSLKQAIEYGSIFSKVGLPTRSIATLATGLGKILDPIRTVTDTNGKLEHGLSSTYLAITQLGLKYSKVAADVKQGNLSGLLLYLKDTAAATNQPLSVLLNTVLGSGGAISGSLLLKNLGAVREVTKGISGAGAGSLQTAFETAAQQFGNRMHIIENQLKNSAAEFGVTLLPFIEDAGNFIANSMQYLSTHHAQRLVFEAGLGTAVAGSIAIKLVGAFNKLKMATNSTTQTTLLKVIADNTGKTAAEGGVGDAEGGAGDAGIVGMSTLGKFGTAVGVFAAGAIAFEATSDFFKTKLGSQIATGLSTSGGDLNPIHDLAVGIAHLDGSLVKASTAFGSGAGIHAYLAAHPNAAGTRGTVNIKHTTKVGFSK